MQQTTTKTKQKETKRKGAVKKKIAHNCKKQRTHELRNITGDNT